MRIDLSDKDRLIYRVAGLVFREDHILLHRSDFENFWTLPGGGCDFGEKSTNALAREFKEELGASVENKGLLWIVENFFDYDGKRVHEIGMYYKCQFAKDSSNLYEVDSFEGEEIHMVTKKPFKLIFKWFPLKDLESIEVFPEFLLKEIKCLPNTPRHIINSNFE